MERGLIKNFANLEGEVCTEPQFNHSTLGENFYLFAVEVPRRSGVSDYIPVMVSERTADIDTLKPEVTVSIKGSFRSYNKHDGGKNHLLLSVLAEELRIIGMGEEMTAINGIELEGYICKPPIYRKTPLGKEITDIMVVVSRSYKKSDYIPCITWGRNAHYAAALNVGDYIQGVGRIQSRIYAKRINESESEKRIAYEVSLGSIN